MSFINRNKIYNIFHFKFHETISFHELVQPSSRISLFYLIQDE